MTMCIEIKYILLFYRQKTLNQCTENKVKWIINGNNNNNNCLREIILSHFSIFKNVINDDNDNSNDNYIYIFSANILCPNCIRKYISTKSISSYYIYTKLHTNTINIYNIYSSGCQNWNY